jgi:hypothetical protein
LDELAFYRLEGSAASDTEIQTSIRRGMLAFADTRLVKISTPFARGGVLYDDFRNHFGTDSTDVLVWKAASVIMNPSLRAERMERQRRLDPQRFRREYEAEFIDDLAALLDAQALEACVVSGRRELLPVGDVRYSAFADPSGGRRDAFAIAVAHRDGDRIVVDCVRAWEPQFDPTSVVAEAATVLKTYRCNAITGDRYAGEWPREAFRSHRIEYSVTAMDRSRLYLELLPLINAGAIDLPDDPKLLHELRGLERRRGSAGRDRVDAPAGQHEDRANAVAGVATELALASDDAHICVAPITILKPDAGMPYPLERLPRF